MGVDDEEVQLRGCCKNADNELDRWKTRDLAFVQAFAAKELDDSNTFDDAGTKDTMKEAVANLVQSFLCGRQLEVSSMIYGAGDFHASFNKELSEMRLEPLHETSASEHAWSIPFIYVLEATVDPGTPGLARYSLNSILRVRLGPHSGHGPDTLILKLTSSECEAMALFLRATSRDLQSSAAWDRQRVMDDESVATTMVRSVQLLKDPRGLASLVLSKDRSEKNTKQIIEENLA